MSMMGQALHRAYKDKQTSQHHFKGQLVSASRTEMEVEENWKRFLQNVLNTHQRIDYSTHNLENYKQRSRL